jgi:hypothetical protein
MASSTWRASFGPLDYPLLTTALENYAAQQRYFAGLLDPDDGQLDHARRILHQQAQDTDDLSKRLDAAFTVPKFEPADARLPFLAYGLFRPGHLAFFQIAEFTASYETGVYLPGYHVKLRDGVPILAPGDGHPVDGVLAHFNSTTAYERIAAMEPRHLYCWECVQVAGQHVNALVGKSPDKGSDRLDGEWDGWTDPLFTDALEVVEESLESAGDVDGPDFKPLYRLQAAYLLLWTSIERYLTLRYHFGPEVSKRIRCLADEDAFRQTLATLAPKPRDIRRTDDPTQRERLLSTDPAKAIKYYYQVRSNITHRGKTQERDFETMRRSLYELLRIFRAVFGAAKLEAAELAASIPHC